MAYTTKQRNMSQKRPRLRVLICICSSVRSRASAGGQFALVSFLNSFTSFGKFRNLRPWLNLAFSFHILHFCSSFDEDAKIPIEVPTANVKAIFLLLSQ